jgi:hypothetical protein
MADATRPIFHHLTEVALRKREFSTSPNGGEGGGQNFLSLQKTNLTFNSGAPTGWLERWPQTALPAGINLA